MSIRRVLVYRYGSVLRLGGERRTFSCRLYIFIVHRQNRLGGADIGTSSKEIFLIGPVSRPVRLFFF
jgi:hypothetical protein